MKKLLLLSILCLLFTQHKLYAQPLPNGGFETWNSKNYIDPTFWLTGSAETVRRMDTIPITQVIGQSGHAVRIQTIVVGSDTSSSYITNSPDNPLNGIGGFPYAQMPTGISGYYRYNLPGNDSALLLVVFKLGGLIQSTDVFKIKGTGSQPTFTAFNFTLTLATTPDTVIIAAASSNLIDNVGIENGSFLELDELAFTGSGITQIIPNGTFEAWRAVTYDKPAGWEAQGDSVIKTTDKYAGTYAVKLKTTDGGNGYANSSAISTAHNSQSGQTGGRPYTNTADTLTGYYKYFPSGADTANVYISLSNNTSPVGGNGLFLSAASSYTYFEIPFSAFPAPDTIRISAISSAGATTLVNVGSTLYLDGLTLKSMATGIVGYNNNAGTPVAFPNPVLDMVTIDFSKNLAGEVHIKVYDISGRVVKEEYVPGTSRVKINVADLSDGVYTYTIMNASENIHGNFVKQ